MPASVDAIRAVRAVANRPIAEIRSALEATGGDVERAIAQLAQTSTKPYEPDPLYVSADEHDIDGVLADFELAAQITEMWLDDPDPQGLHDLCAKVALPIGLVRFLERWDGVDDRGSVRIWGAQHARQAPTLDDHDGEECEDAFPIGEQDGVGYLFVRLAHPGVYFFDNENERQPVTLLAKNFESFLRDWIHFDLDLVDVKREVRLRERAARGT